MSLTSLLGKRHGLPFDDGGDDDVMALSLSSVEWSCVTEHYPAVRITS